MSCPCCGLPDTAAGKVYSLNDVRAMERYHQLPQWVRDQYPCIGDWAEDSDALSDTVPRGSTVNAIVKVTAAYPTSAAFNRLTEGILSLDVTQCPAEFIEVCEALAALKTDLLYNAECGIAILNELINDEEP